ncbi:alpha-galactosidase [Phytohabitans rumicis]|uniref:Alpha-galactosidase n=2 Tax=Phytohabitans rumicis TaxID=1076125 RepID=A0A6V8LGU7_9ACTN|nr:alpha-galactosidase [Phytohabitans rumicis]
MGWNSWDCYGTTVTEDEVVANAEFMAERLAPYGWDTVVVDIQWYEPTARAGGYNADAPLVLDAYGRPQPAPNRFPSAAGGRGFAPLAARVHDLGLRFGLHIMRGIPRRAVAANLPVLGTAYRAGDVADRASTCPWNPDNYGLDHTHPGARAYYESLAGMFAEWGVDYVKADDMLVPYHEAEIAALSRALRATGRPMALSLSPGTGLAVERIDHLREYAHLWRVSDDLWDRWEDVYAQFERMARWAPLSGPDGWADADMLPLGRIGIRAERGTDRASRLTWDEQRTLMTLWCVSRSPLMFGGDLPTSDPRTIDLLTNADVLAVLKHSRGNRQERRDGDLVIWTAEATDREARYLAVFAVGDHPLDLDLPLPAGTHAVDLWTGENAPSAVTLPAHGSALYRVT